MNEKYIKGLKRVSQMLALFGVAAASLTAAQAQAQAQATDSRIMYGQDAKVGRWPWQVQVNVGGFLCGGVVLNQNWVATAAHCVDGFSLSDISVVAGHSDRLSPEDSAQAREITSVQREPTGADIALLRVDEPWVYTREVQPALLSRVRATSGTTAATTGWGMTESGNLARILREVFLPIVDHERCNRNFALTSPLTRPVRPHEYCVGYEDGRRDSCNGDSGGPLVVPDSNGGASYRLAGLVARGPRHQDTGALCYSYGVYVGVHDFLGWIDSTIGTQDLIGDINGDGCVNGTDAALVIQLLGFPSPPSIADIDEDGLIGFAELGLVYSQWKTSLNEDPAECSL